MVKQTSVHGDLPGGNREQKQRPADISSDGLEEAEKHDEHKMNRYKQNVITRRLTSGKGKNVPQTSAQTVWNGLKNMMNMLRNRLKNVITRPLTWY